MVIRSLIKKINNNSLVEIISMDKVRLFYGKIKEIDKLTMKIWGGSHIAEINPFVAQVGIRAKQPCIQITIEEKVLK